MKIKLLLFSAFCALIFSTNVVGQTSSVRITRDKITYKRTGDRVPDHKKTFDVTYARISGVSDPKTLRNIKNSIDMWKQFDVKLEDNLKDDTWLFSLDHRVTYNKNSILAMTLIMEGSGAYPSTSTKRLVIDLRTGMRVGMQDVFADIPKLLVKIDGAQKAEIKHEIAEVKRTEGAEDAQELNRLIKSSGYSVNKFEEFSVSDAGVVFYYDYGFAHAVKALEPPGRYFFSWASVRDNIKRGGLLEKFIN